MEPSIRDELRRAVPEDLVPLATLLELFADVEHRQEDERLGMALTVESMGFDLPFELNVRVDPDGRAELHAAPPTQELETSVMPVFHRLVVRMVRDGVE